MRGIRDLVFDEGEDIAGRVGDVGHVAAPVLLGGFGDDAIGIKGAEGVAGLIEVFGVKRVAGESADEIGFFGAGHIDGFEDQVNVAGTVDEVALVFTVGNAFEAEGFFVEDARVVEVFDENADAVDAHMGGSSDGVMNNRLRFNAYQRNRGGWLWMRWISAIHLSHITLIDKLYYLI
ncbi:hypothetical protein KS4_27440 [Poriferisphaera corsica]|uniref:Uncharacterized protein n=1 Tax=Poriferisphaera corsica TaxID=2528020 RepID=A0A517YWQ7_9BACT|nr:hypothetical protein KS4_27440 [Poriferisphaera corsica]